MPAPAEHDDAIVLRSVAYGEADRVVTLLTRGHGRLSALARAARRSKRRFAGSLEGFAFIAVELSFGRGSLANLASARVTRSFPTLLSDLPRMEAAGAVLRLARELIPERVADLATYEALCQMLVVLDAPELPPKPLLLVSQAHLLAVTGFAPLLSACALCGKQPREGQPALFDPARGGIVCRACGGGPERVSAAVRAHLTRALEGELARAAAAPWSEAELREAERLLASFIRQVLPQSDRAGGAPI